MQLFSILEVLKDVNSQPTSLYATGGGISYPAWTQILSDVLGVKLIIPTVTSPEATGAAILAGLGINGIDRTVTFAEKMVVTPRKHAHEIYSRAYQQYRRICNFLASK
jgi:sugar (pentulose or hexulose) kinase